MSMAYSLLLDSYAAGKHSPDICSGTSFFMPSNDTPDNGSRLSGAVTSGLEGRVPQLQIKLLTQLQKAFCFLLFWILSRLFP